MNTEKKKKRSTLSDWSTFSRNLLFQKSCVPDFSSKSLLVILMFSFLIESFLLQGSNGLSMMVALEHFFLAEIQDSNIPLTSFSGEFWSRLFVSERMKIYLILELLENFKFCILIVHVEFYSQVYQNLKCYGWKNIFFQISGYLSPKL